jgi:hypothetical protein
MIESHLRRALLVRLSELGIFAWNNPTGVACPLGTTRPVRYGLPGAPDIIAVLPPHGRLLAIEAKTHTRQRPEQIAWQRRAEKVGALYLVVHSVDEMERGIELAFHA